METPPVQVGGKDPPAWSQHTQQGALSLRPAGVSRRESSPAGRTAGQRPELRPAHLCPPGLALGDVPGQQSIGIVLTVLGVVVLDFSADATEGPIRAYLLDVVDSEDQDMALNIHAFSAGECPARPHPGPRLSGQLLVGRTPSGRWAPYQLPAGQAEQGPPPAQ